MVALLGCAATGPGLEAPDGYGVLAEPDHPAAWQEVSGEFPTPDRAEGDYDGDGLTDQARLFVAESGSGWAAVAALSSRPDTVFRLMTSEDALGREILRTVERGVHRTHQYSGIGPGDADTTAVVRLEHAAINLGRLESEGHTFVWDAERGAFDRIAMY